MKSWVTREGVERVRDEQKRKDFADGKRLQCLAVDTETLPPSFFSTKTTIDRHLLPDGTMTSSMTFSLPGQV